MSELDLQKKILKKIRKKIFKNKKIFEEKAHLNGSTDIVVLYKKTYISIEIKKYLNQRVFEQLNNQALFATHLVAIAFRPHKKETAVKWEKFAKENMVNLIYFENNFGNIRKRNFTKIKNLNYDLEYTRIVGN